MRFTVDDMMRNSFVMARDAKEAERFFSRMAAAGFTDMPRLYVGQYPNDIVGEGAYICPLNHFVLVNMARTLGLDHVTIFESDAFPMKSCKDVLGDFLGSGGVPDDADEVVFGNLHFIRDWRGNMHDRKCLVDVDERERYGKILHDLWGAHAVTVFERGYDTWLGNYLSQKTQIGADFFNWLTPNCYATTRSFFIQVKDELQYPEKLRDKELLCEFPEI